MAKPKKAVPYFASLNGSSPSIVFNTDNVFDNTTLVSSSPIDVYMKRNQALIKKVGLLEREDLLSADNDEDRDIYNLFLLGFVSNVESYFRTIIREVITFDIHSYNACLEQPLTYAAALHHTRELLPEALMENHTFISKHLITKALIDYLKITINTQETKGQEVTECLQLFEQLCQLRHCIVHRAGLLGSKNAIKLGIDSHKGFFEKPIRLNTAFLQNANVICLNCVRTSNTYIFNKLIHRYVAENDGITWKFPNDKRWYLKYYTLFISQKLNESLVQNGIELDTPFKTYEKLRASFEKKD
ncbi:hypothetical protein GCM10007978_07440 [Shewanella hanedai]|uniref:Uncharacterized protein n=1 Tax=Shewanella hanedai TaxID=25 RepID=A0A553JT33_SHEHA|nr:hypothetical protein [Shewanella hanedai]TRY15614.1 hypothetical protein FN961_03830 [Shewanella hanedai]GGI72031.1 hypothetical protein GCM10007978_07440 [Shewanella hanedai]